MKMRSSEEMHLYNLSLVPAGMIFVVFLFVFVYSLHNNLLGTIWDFLWFAIPFWILIIDTIFFSFEMLYKKKTNKPFNLKRFVGRTILTTTGFALFIALATLFKSLQFLWISESTTLLLSGITWFAVWIILFISLKQRFDKLSQGTW